ncbi:MAG: alginate export family protein [Candidatus Omnitrophica bacterium]|nr:alginate export family protein [Candidatus Omnitrophota bacterium]
MGKRLILVLALALLVGLTFSAAYAEVQNVKVSGDFIVSGVARNHFNLENNTAGDKSVLKQTFLMSQIRVRIDADLTDNVQATVRLINERIWNGQNDHGVAGHADDNDNTSIDLDLAYVTLKEFLYSPLTLTVGRQEIKFGNGLVIGNAKVIGTSSSIPTDLTERKAFDAIRATLDYDPLVVDLVYAQVKQTNSVDRNTVSLTGINATYAINKKTDVSAYYWLKRNNNTGIATSRTDQLSTIGALVSTNPIENLTASFEAAYQFGKNTETLGQKKHNALALQAMVDYTFAKVKMAPKIGASYTYLSGTKTGETRNSGWDSMFYDQKLNNIVYALLPFSNMNAFNLKGSMKPVEDVTVALVYGYYNAAQRDGVGYAFASTYDRGTNYNINGNYTGKAHLGQALDATVTYDYTEDVQFGLTGGYFLPGNGITVDSANAQQLIGSMKVIF